MAGSSEHAGHATAAGGSPAAAGAAAAIRASGVVAGPSPAVDELLVEARFTDHHVHGVLRGTLPPERLIVQLSESDRPSAAAAAGMDTQLGIAVRRWTAPLLGMAPSVPADEWLAHRATLDNEAVAASILPLSGIGELLVDTGYRGTLLTSPDELGALAGVPAREVVRLEVVAEEVATSGVTATGYAAALHDALVAATRHAIGTKSIVAYRFGFDFDPAPPPAGEVAAAAGAWLRSIESGAPVRLADPTLLRHLLWEAVGLGLPLQLHTGYGDSDLDLHRCDPALLTGFLRRTDGTVPILLLHTYPYTRSAGYLAEMFAHVHLDVGLAVNHTGAAAERTIAETLELAPLTKVLFSSDAWGLPELHLLGSWLLRRGLSRIVGRWVVDGDWSLADARRAIELLSRENAARVYTLGPG